MKKMTKKSYLLLQYKPYVKRCPVNNHIKFIYIDRFIYIEIIKFTPFF